MAVTGLGCNPPLWRFHRGPDPLPSLCAPISNPEALPGPVLWGDLPPQPYKQNPAAGETGGGAQVCVFLSLPSVSFRRVTMPIPR